MLEDFLTNIKDILVVIKMEKCKTSPTLASTSRQLSKTGGRTFSNHFLYRSTIDALQYVLLTKSELSFIVNKLSQFMQNPTKFP